MLDSTNFILNQSGATAMRAVGVTFDREPAAHDSAITEVLNLRRTLVDAIKTKRRYHDHGGAIAERRDFFQAIS